MCLSESYITDSESMRFNSILWFAFVIQEIAKSPYVWLRQGQDVYNMVLFVHSLIHLWNKH
jgi:hypothetical protein